MKKLTLTFGLLIITVSCIAQNKKIIKQTSGYDGSSLPYITEETFKETQINNVLKLKNVMGQNSIEHISSQLGTPKDIELDEDKGIDGTILFETKIVKYPGLIFYYSKHKTFKISSIDFTSDNYFFEIDDNKVQVGMSLNQLSNILPSPLDTSGEKSKVTLFVLQTDQYGNLKKDEAGNIRGGYRYINFMIDSTTKKVKKISIVFIVP